MSTSSFKNNAAGFQFVDEKPIRLDVTFPTALITADKRVVSMNRIEALSGHYRAQDHLQRR